MACGIRGAKDQQIAENTDVDQPLLQCLRFDRSESWDLLPHQLFLNAKTDSVGGSNHRGWMSPIVVELLALHDGGGKLTWLTMQMIVQENPAVAVIRRVTATCMRSRRVMVRSITQRTYTNGETPTTSPDGVAHSLILVTSMEWSKHTPLVVANTVGAYTNH